MDLAKYPRTWGMTQTLYRQVFVPIFRGNLRLQVYTVRVPCAEGICVAPPIQVSNASTHSYKHGLYKRLKYLACRRCINDRKTCVLSVSTNVIKSASWI